MIIFSGKMIEHLKRKNKRWLLVILNKIYKFIARRYINELNRYYKQMNGKEE